MIKLGNNFERENENKIWRKKFYSWKNYKNTSKKIYTAQLTRISLKSK